MTLEPSSSSLLKWVVGSMVGIFGIGAAESAYLSNKIDSRIEKDAIHDAAIVGLQAALAEETKRNRECQAGVSQLSEQQHRFAQMMANLDSSFVQAIAHLGENDKIIVRNVLGIWLNAKATNEKLNNLGAAVPVPVAMRRLNPTAPTVPSFATPAPGLVEPPPLETERMFTRPLR